MATRDMRLLTAYFPESGYVIEDVLAVEERLFYNLLTTQNYLEGESFLSEPDATKFCMNFNLFCINLSTQVSLLMTQPQV